MYTIIWRENETDQWDRLETKEETLDLLDDLAKREGVCEGDIWIFLPEADNHAADYLSFMAMEAE